ncbi:MAG: hypothetical protein ACI92S_005205, partial [Planctomycetaceae bacterium]
MSSENIRIPVAVLFDSRALVNVVEDGATTWRRGFVCNLNPKLAAPRRSFYQAAYA